MIKYGPLAGRIGMIKLSRSIIERNPEMFELVMKNFYPVYMENYDFIREQIKYTGYSHFFRVKAEDEFPPEYQITCTLYQGTIPQITFKEQNMYRGIPYALHT